MAKCYRQSRSKDENITTTLFDFDWLIEIAKNCHFIYENGLSPAYTYFRSFCRKYMTTALSWKCVDRQNAITRLIFHALPTTDVVAID
jgi:hypothetical protein